MTQRHSTNGLVWHSSDLLQTPNAMFSRRGGCSSAPFDSLNLSYSVGDDEDAVWKNRQYISELMGLDRLCATRQVHGDFVFAVQEKTGEHDLVEADALITDQPGVGLLIQQADCQAILLHDPITRVVAAIHCGWRGSVLGIIGTTIVCLQQTYGSQPHNILAVISPSLGPCCAEFRHYQEELPKAFLPFRQDNCHFDFWQISRRQLCESGVQAENIEITEQCTSCSNDFFSYRRANRAGTGITGRNGSVIALENS